MPTQPVNPFNNQPYTGSVISNITHRKELGLADNVVVVEFPLFNNFSDTKIEFIEWDFLHNNATDAEYAKIQHLIQGLWLNGYPIVEGNEAISLKLFQQKLVNAPLPRTPKEKLDSVMTFLAGRQKEHGAGIGLDLNIAYKRMYLNSITEGVFYLDTLVADGLIRGSGNGNNGYNLAFTFKGLSYVASLENEGPNSNYCFVAISFADEMAARRDSILKTIKYHGYEPIIVNSDFIVKNDRPVIDEILAGIKRARFCISDFTMQRSGVYFEAGYALGLGRPVIYLSEREDFITNSHFDLRPFQHILYSGLEELERDLSAKIAAWIGSRRPEYNAK